jgi:hypothetical protein
MTFLDLDRDFNNISVRNFILTGAPLPYLESMRERLVDVLVPIAFP